MDVDTVFAGGETCYATLPHDTTPRQDLTRLSLILHFFSSDFSQPFLASRNLKTHTHTHTHTYTYTHTYTRTHTQSILAKGNMSEFGTNKCISSNNVLITKYEDEIKNIAQVKISQI